MQLAFTFGKEPFAEWGIQCRASQLAGAHRTIRKNGTNGARLEARRTLGTGVDRVSKARRACRLSIPPVSPSIRPVHNPTRVFANAPFLLTLRSAIPQRRLACPPPPARQRAELLSRSTGYRRATGLRNPPGRASQHPVEHQDSFSRPSAHAMSRSRMQTHRTAMVTSESSRERLPLYHQSSPRCVCRATSLSFPPHVAKASPSIEPPHTSKSPLSRLAA